MYIVECKVRDEPFKFVFALTKCTHAKEFPRLFPIALPNRFSMSRLEYQKRISVTDMHFIYKPQRLFCNRVLQF